MLMLRPRTRAMVVADRRSVNSSGPAWACRAGSATQVVGHAAMATDTGRNPRARLELGPDNAAVRTLLAGLAHARDVRRRQGRGRDVGDTGAGARRRHGADRRHRRGELQDVFGGAKAQYNARGITDTRPDILRLDWLTDRLAIVEVRWPYLTADGDEVGEETSTYVIRREPDGQLAIRATVMHGEAATH